MMMIEVNVDAILGLGGEMVRPVRAGGCEQGVRLRMDDDEKVGRYQQKIGELWESYDLAARLRELEAAAEELGWKGDEGEEGGLSDEEVRVQEMMDMMMWMVTECMRIAEREVMGGGSWAKMTKNKRFKDGWSPEFAQEAKS